MKLMLTKLLLLLGLLNLQGQCDHYWIKVSVGEDSTFSSNNPEYQVRIEVLMEDAGICDDFGMIDFKVFSNCGEKKLYTAFQSGQQNVDSSSQNCFGLSEFADYALYKKTYLGSFNLDSFACPDLTVYCERGTNSFRNISNSDSVPVTIAGWVQIDTYYEQNLFPWIDTTFKVIEACKNVNRSFNPLIGPKWGWDSTKIQILKPTTYNLDSSQSLKVTRDFEGSLNKHLPFPAHVFNKSKLGIEFTASDTGLFVVPLRIDNWRNDTIQNLYYLASKSYLQVPIYVSDSCYSGLNQVQTFRQDTMSYSCDSVFSIPLNDNIAVETISQDGSDFKFHNANGYPVIVERAFTQDPFSSYTDTINIEAQFFFDGYYEVEMIAGADGDKVISQCGYELQSQDRFTMYLSGCPNSVMLHSPKLHQTAIFPNPTQGIVRISSALPISNIVITNLSGSKISTPEYENAGNEVSINVDHFPSGIYFVRLRFADGSVSMEKLIVE